MAENPRIEELRRRVHADPASIAFAALAEEFRRVGRFDEAVDTCRKGLIRHPAYLSARVTLGRALIETGDFEAARVELETVLRSAPENLVAIRGLAQIQERLGQSAPIDPQLANVANTAHAAALPVVSLPPIELAAFAETPADKTANEPSPPSAPDPPVVPEAPVTDPFAAFTATSAESKPDLSFDLSTALTIQSKPAPAEPELDLMMTPATEVVVELPAESVAEPEFETPVALDMAINPEPESEPESESESEPVAEPESEPELAVQSGPDPEVLATLARLERFLGAIESLRA